MTTELDPFDRTADMVRTTETKTPEEQWAQRLEDARREAMVHAEMALEFVHTLKKHMTHNEALYLTAQIWRSWPAG